MLKILLIGMGSIGRRHLQCLQSFGNIDLASLRTLKGTLNEKTGIKEFYNFQEALKFKPNGVIVSNPTSLHIETAIPFLEKGIKVLIEKPVSHDLATSRLLLPYEKDLRIAYCMRFHPLNDLISSILKKEIVFKLGFKRSYYLPKWHPYADYRLEYTAKRELGGGVIRTLSHEIDLMLNWFGNPKSFCGVIDKVSNLEIDTDDYAFFSCQYQQGFRVNFELDFLSPVNVNTGELFTDKGKYQWDMKNFWFTAYNEVDKNEAVVFDEDSLNQMYVKQLEDFLKFIETGKSKNTTLVQGINLLTIIEELDAKA